MSAPLEVGQEYESAPHSIYIFYDHLSRARVTRIYLIFVGYIHLAALKSLRKNGYEAPLKERIQADRPTLCVCVGLQVKHDLYLVHLSTYSASIRLGI